ncbi:MAG: hypothetical protein EAZ89_07270 [Bacteroidetes bacterium]|nr:MAG: hypothetical protein EAZ89_07270 [Bacteroidota bacterium]
MRLTPSIARAASGWLILALTALMACQSDPDADIRDIELDISFRRSDSLMLACAQALRADTTLSYVDAFARYLAPDRTFFLRWALDPMQVATLSDAGQDSLLAASFGPLLRDTSVFHLLDTVRQVYPYDYPFAERLLPPLKRLKKYFPDINLPEFRTHVNGFIPSGDMRSVDQIVSVEGYISFGLHYFLGRDLKYYPINISKYQRQRFSSEHIELALIDQIAQEILAPPAQNRQPQLVDGMIRAGIRQYLIQQLLPNTPDSTCLMYSSAQMEWAEYYEDRIYKELIPHLFSTDFQLQRDYLSDKPYTTQLSPESAPRIGEYCGWKIVSSYMERNPETTLADLVSRTDYDVIFKESRYKP